MNCLIQIPSRSVSSPMFSRATSPHFSASLPIQQHSIVPTPQLSILSHPPRSWNRRRGMKRLIGSSGECLFRITTQWPENCLIFWQHASAKDCPQSSVDWSGSPCPRPRRHTSRPCIPSSSRSNRPMNVLFNVISPGRSLRLTCSRRKVVRDRRACATFSRHTHCMTLTSDTAKALDSWSDHCS